eukprot:scaffold49926_cov55-Phaeocystis_antarctica.AAC.4
MGNSNSTSSSSLGIQLDQPAIYAGGTVTGKVFLQVRKDTEADTLQLMLVGQEHAHVHWTTTRTTGTGDNRKTETVHHHAYANRILVQIDGGTGQLRVPLLSDAATRAADEHVRARRRRRLPHLVRAQGAAPPAELVQVGHHLDALDHGAVDTAAAVAGAVLRAAADGAGEAVLLPRQGQDPHRHGRRRHAARPRPERGHRHRRAERIEQEARVRHRHDQGARRVAGGGAQQHEPAHDRAYRVGHGRDGRPRGALQGRAQGGAAGRQGVAGRGAHADARGACGVSARGTGARDADGRARRARLVPGLVLEHDPPLLRDEQDAVLRDRPAARGARAHRHPAAAAAAAANATDADSDGDGDGGRADGGGVPGPAAGGDGRGHPARQGRAVRDHRGARRLVGRRRGGGRGAAHGPGRRGRRRAGERRAGGGAGERRRTDGRRARGRAAPPAGHDGCTQGDDGSRIRRPDDARRPARPAGERGGVAAAAREPQPPRLRHRRRRGQPRVRPAQGRRAAREAAARRRHRGAHHRGQPQGRGEPAAHHRHQARAAVRRPARQHRRHRGRAQRVGPHSLQARAAARSVERVRPVARVRVHLYSERGARSRHFDVSCVFCLSLTYMTNTTRLYVTSRARARHCGTPLRTSHFCDFCVLPFGIL